MNRRPFTLLLLLLLFYPLSSLALTKQCALPQHTVVYQQIIDYKHACDAIDRTIQFMSGYGFATDTPLYIEMKAEVTNRHQYAVYGQYHPSSNRIEIITYSTFLSLTANKRIFGLQGGGELYVSFIAHEIAHAIAQANFTFTPPFLAHEYIAYVVQLAVMKEEVRQQIFADFPYDGFQSADEINSIYYGLHPNNFGLKSYLHFTHLEDAKAFFNRLLTHDILDQCARTEFC